MWSRPKKAFSRIPERATASATVGNALKLEFQPASADVVLLLGPLYHLTRRRDRLRALREAHRILRPAGTLFAVGISRFASLLDGLKRRFLADPQFVSIVKQDLESGQHRNSTENPEYWTVAFFHRPDQLEAEIREAGFRLEKLIAIEGPGWVLDDLHEFWSNADRKQHFFELISNVESEKTLLGASPHILAVATKPHDRHE